MALVDVDLNGGADIAGGDTLFDGFTTINNNNGKLAGGAAAATSGAKEIGYYDGASATNVQDALDAALVAAFTGVNVGGESGEVFRDKTTDLNFRTIKAGTNVTLDVTTDTDVIEINAGLSNSANVTFVDSGFPYTTLSTDEIILVNSQDAAVGITLQAGTDKRILNIKNLGWNGTGASNVPNTTEVTITPTGGHIEDDRTGTPTTATSIGPGSAMRVVYDAATDVWCII